MLESSSANKIFRNQGPGLAETRMVSDNLRSNVFKFEAKFFRKQDNFFKKCQISTLKILKTPKKLRKVAEFYELPPLSTLLTPATANPQDELTSLAFT